MVEILEVAVGHILIMTGEILLICRLILAFALRVRTILSLNLKSVYADKCAIMGNYHTYEVNQEP